MEYEWMIHGLVMEIKKCGCNGTMMGDPQTKRAFNGERIKLNGGFSVARFDYPKGLEGLDKVRVKPGDLQKPRAANTWNLPNCFVLVLIR